MTRTPDQVAAESALETALHNVAAAYGISEDGVFVGDWVAVVEVQHPEQEGRTAYELFVSGGVLPAHRVFGLLSMGEDLMADAGVGDD